MSLLQVTSQKLKDAVGQTGIYSGQVRVDSDQPEGKGMMEYTEEGPIQNYDGDWNAGYWHGQGSCTLKNGDVYKGEFVRHERHGNGEYTWASSGNKQRIYQGMFHHNQRQGHGKYTWRNLATPTPNSESKQNEDDMASEVASISTYVGMFDNGQRQGHGVYTSPQIQYTGEWYGGQYHGYGVLESPKSTYRGYFQRGQKCGRGVETSKRDGIIIHEGQWANDQPVLAPSPTFAPGKKASPHHTIVLRNPEPVIDGQGREGLYKGILQDNLPQGVGTMSYNQHPEFILEYEGFWQQGMKHGFGRVSYMTGDSYQGHLEQNLRHGQGELTTSDGRHYKGNFNKGLPHDKENFRVVYPKNDMYLGGYSQGQRSGVGKFVWNDGGYYNGKWTEGVYCGKGEIVTATTMYKGDFEQGLYHGTGCLTNMQTNTIIYEGEWKEGLPVVEDDSISNLLLSIPQAPLDYDITQQPVSSAPDSYPAPQHRHQQAEQQQMSLTSSIFSGFSSLMMNEPAAPPSPQKPVSVTPKISTSIQQNPSPSKNPKTSEVLDKEACKAVVDMAVWDGQDNPGRYTGILHVASQRPHGVGRMVYDDGNRVHEGFWEYGHRQGHGRCLFVQIGDFHEGNYNLNLRQGPGTYYWKDGRQFVGIYDQDERQGEGKFTYPNGDVYEGNFNKGQRNGFGVFTFHNKSCQYQGEWESGMYSGSGTLQWQSTREYQGSRLRQICQHRYEGSFEKGLFAGEGIEYENDQIVRQGTWNKGKFVEPSKPTIDHGNHNIEDLSPEEEEQTIKEPTEEDQDDPTPEEKENDDPPLQNSMKRESLGESPSSLEQSYDDQHVQWRRSLEPSLAEI